MKIFFVTALVLIGSMQAMAGSDWKCTYQFEGNNIVRIEYVNYRGEYIVSLNHVNSDKRTNKFNFTVLGLGTDISIDERDKPAYSPMKDWRTVRAYSSVSKRAYFLDLKNQCATNRTQLCPLITVIDRSKGILLNQGDLKCNFSGGGE
jgi:hypothetical protein